MCVIVIMVFAFALNIAIDAEFITIIPIKVDPMPFVSSGFDIDPSLNAASFPHTYIYNGIIVRFILSL